MKKILLVIIIISIILSFTSFCYADELEDNINENLNDLDLSELEDYYSYISEMYNNSSIKDVIKEIIYGEFNGDYKDFLNIVLNYLKNELYLIIPSILSLISIAIIYSMLDNFSSSKNNGITKIIYYVCYISSSLIIFVWIKNVVDETALNIQNIQKFVNIIFPILLTILSALGGISLTNVFGPILSILTTFIINIINNVIMPLFILIIIINFVSNLSSEIKLDKMQKLIKSVTTIILTGMFSLYITFLSIQGLTSSIVDTVSIKTAKFALSTYIPVLGGYLSDGFDLILASLVLIKNSIGVVGVFILLFMILSPVIKIIIISLSLKFVAAVTEPLSNNRMPKMMYDLSKELMILLGVLIGIFFMSLFTIMLIIFACNLGAI